MDPPSHTLGRLADLLGAELDGDPSATVASVAPIDRAGPDELTFALDARNAARLADSQAGAALVDRSVVSAPMPLLRVEDVNAALIRLLGELRPEPHLPAAGCADSACVDPSAEVDPSARIGPGAVVGPGCRVGADTVLSANVVLGADVSVGEACRLDPGAVVGDRCRIGDRVRIGPNSVIGHEGFGYYPTSDGRHVAIPHAGNAVLGDDVELGACVCVDRAKFGSTVVGEGTKVDNLVQIAHNVQVGPHCLLVAQVGIAGSTRLGHHVVLGGHVGVRDNVSVGDGVRCAAYSAIAGDVPDGESVGGIPAEKAGMMLRIYRAKTRLPELLKRVKALESKVEALESADDR